MAEEQKEWNPIKYRLGFGLYTNLLLPAPGESSEEAEEHRIDRILFQCEELSKSIEEWGMKPTDCGCGFGYRDMQFELDGDRVGSTELAKEVKQKTIDWLQNKFGDPRAHDLGCKYAEHGLWYVGLTETANRSI